MVNTAPSLDSRGWITDPNIMLDRLMAYYTASNYHQSLMFRGKIFSLQKAIFDCGQDMEMLATRVQSDLSMIMSRNYTEGSTVETNIVEDDTSAKVELQIAVTVIYGGKTYELQKAISTTSSVFITSQNAKAILG